MTRKLNRYSSRITEPKSQGASQAMLYGTGLTDADMAKAEIGIGAMWWEGNTCNMHLNDLAAKVKEGVVTAGLVGMRFNTIGVSDGICMGTDGMSYSLQSREIIADSIETVMGAQWYDALVTLPGCDKNMPGCLIAMGRLNRPALMIYGGTIKPGHSHGHTLDIVSAFQSYGEFIAGKIDEPTRQDIVHHSCPGAGACGGMYTANTMASAIEALGMSLPYSSSTPAVDPGKLAECLSAGLAIKNLLEQDIKPRDIMTRAAFGNAMVMVMALGGSTNAVLHLIAMARAVGVKLRMMTRGHSRCRASAAARPHTAAASVNATHGRPRSRAAAPVRPPTANAPRRRTLKEASPRTLPPAAVWLNVVRDGDSSAPAPSPRSARPGTTSSHDQTEAAATAARPIAHPTRPSRSHSL